MSATIVVTGGTGTLGRQVVPLLQSAGRTVRVLTRHPGANEDGVEHVHADLDSGLDPAVVEGAGAILHLAGSQHADEMKARSVVAAAAAAKVPHVLTISVVGADRVPVHGRMARAMFGYYRAQLAAERVVQTSPVPWTILRATQFHDLLLMLCRALVRSPVMPVPALRAQPVDVQEVAARLVELTLGDPAGRVDDLAGPEVLTLREVFTTYLATTDRHRLLVPVPLPGEAAAAIRAGALLTGRPGSGRTWAAFLADRA